MKSFKIISALLVIASSLNVGAQQQAMFTQYMFNKTAINPAAVGSDETLSFTALIRQQWVGIEGAPTTQTASLHSPLMNDQMGLGITVLRDQIGITRQHGIFGAYSYRINFTNSTLSMGLQIGAIDFNSDQNELNPNTPDGSLQESYRSGFKPNFGTGAYYYSDRFYLGVSAPMLVNHNFLEDNPDMEEVDQRKHYFLMAGYVFDLTSGLKLKPNVLIKAVDGAPIEVDLNANLLIEEVVWVGLSYRSFDSIDAILELQLSTQLRVGYAHDFTTSELRHANRGTHEIMLNYRFKTKNKKAITPRYF